MHEFGDQSLRLGWNILFRQSTIFGWIFLDFQSVIFYCRRGWRGIPWWCSPKRNALKIQKCKNMTFWFRFCVLCRNPFPAGEKVSFSGSEYLCQRCSDPPPSRAPVDVHSKWHLVCFSFSLCSESVLTSSKTAKTQCKTTLKQQLQYNLRYC